MAYEAGGGGGSGVGGDFIYFLGIIAVIFAVWVASGGPSRPISFAGPFLRPIGTTATTAQPYGDPNQYQPVQGTSWIPFIGNNPSIPGDGSTYRGVVTLSRDTTGPKNSDPKTEYVTIQASFQASEPISTLGWKLVSSETKTTASFPQGAELVRSGKVNTLSAIVLRPGDQAIVTSGRSPVGVSFRENLCSGYLEEHQNFIPALSLQCPSPSQDFSRMEGTDDQCLSYLRTFPRCETDTTYNNDVSSSCESFVDDYVNYNGCMDLHDRDSGFLTSTWRVYLGSSSQLWKSERETIMLVDAEGKTIDALSY